MSDGKFKAFIASSGEALFAARIFADLIKPQVVAILWHRGADVGETILEYLERMAREVDIAVVLVTPEDRLTSRDEEFRVARDNVIFELGLFMGALGRRNTFILRQEDDDLKLPADLGGLIYFTYLKPTGKDYRSVLESPALKLLEKVNSRTEKEHSRAVYLPPIAASLQGHAHLVQSVATSLIENGTGRFECFALNPAGTIAHCYETKPRDGWSAWTTNYQGIRDAADVSVLLYDQRLLVAILHRDGNLTLFRQVNRAGTWGPPQTEVPGLAVKARLLATTPAQVVSVRGEDVVIAQISQGPLSFSPIPGLEHQGDLTWLDAILGNDGTIHIIAINRSGRLVHARQLPAVPTSQWSPWQLVAPAASPVGVRIGIGGGGRLFVAFCDGNGHMCLRAMRHPEGTNWVDVEGFHPHEFEAAPLPSSLAFRSFERGMRLYARIRNGKLVVFSIDEGTLSGASEAIDDANVESVLCTSVGNEDDPILIGSGDTIEVRRAR